MTKLILVGGFLGSGKTDRAQGLVDTAILSGPPCGVKEVAGVSPDHVCEPVRGGESTRMAGLTGAAIRATTTEFRCLTPGRPQPTYRYPVA